MIRIPANTAISKIKDPGAVGDRIEAIIAIPLSKSPGAIKIKDGSAGTEITLFAGGTDSLTELKPFRIDIDSKSTTGEWYASTGANIDIIVLGLFS